MIVSAPGLQLMTQTEYRQEIYCPDCGYDLRQIASDRCPECGLVVDRSTLGESVIPWVHRKKIGRVRAFWRTVEMVSLRSEKLVREMNCPARLADAVKFRQFVVLHVLLPFGVVLSIGSASAIGNLWVQTDVLGSIFQIVSLVVGWFCLASFLSGITGVAGYFFHPRSLRR